MNATPRPWIYDYESRTIRKIEKGTGSKADPIQYGMTLASLQQDFRMQPKQAEVNGEFIVRAVNSYDAMREALEEIIRNVEPWKTADNMAGRLHEIASNALALAKGEQ